MGGRPMLRGSWFEGEIFLEPRLERCETLDETLYTGFWLKVPA